MGLWASFRTKLTEWRDKPFTLLERGPWGWLTSGHSYVGRPINERSAMQISTVWACVRLLAETVGSLPVAVYRTRADGSTERADDHWSAALLESPNRNMTSSEYREAKMVNLALRGNGYSVKELSGPRTRIVSALFPVASQNVVPELKKTGEMVYRVNDGTRNNVYPSDEIFHLKGFGGDGYVGLSAISYARHSMGLASAYEEFASRLFSNGLLHRGVIKLPGIINDDKKREAFKTKLKEQFANLENAHGVMLLEGGSEWQPTTMLPEDAQFLQSRNWQVNEICRLFLMPPHMVAQLDRATFSNIEEQWQYFLNITLMAYLTKWEGAFKARILRPEDRSKYFLRFNVEGLLRANSLARAMFYSIMLQNGVVNRNEVRGKENLNRVEGLDDYTIQSNMMLATMIGEAVAKQLQQQQQSASNSGSNNDAQA